MNHPAIDLNRWEDDEDDEVERYELREPPRYRFTANRREFAQTLGAGLLIVVASSEAAGQTRGRAPRRGEALSQRFHLGDDGTLTVLTSKVEVGQGSRTQITQAVAEEIDLPIERIGVIMADSAQCPDDGGTAGSRTTPATVPRVRAATASLRRVMTEFVARQFGVQPEQVMIKDGVFIASPEHRMSLAELARNETFVKQMSDTSIAEGARLVAVEDWKVLGSSVPKVGGRDVVTGAAIYPSDVRLPGMLYGKVVRPPSYGAMLQSVDLQGAGSLGGVVVHDGSFVGCAAETSWQASKIKEALASRCKWEGGLRSSSDDLFEQLKQTARGSGRDAGRDASEPARARPTAGQQFQGSYTIAYVQHAPMEPRAAVAQWTDGKLTVWTGTQQPARVHGELCSAFRLPPESVRLLVPDTGGGFGGKHTGEAAVEAARLAKAARRPVSLRWTREEEFTWAYFRPAGLIEVEAALDPSGRLVAWDFTNFNSGRSAIETPYRVAKAETRFFESAAPLRQGSYRALASAANTFARESAMDELALLAGLDPLEFRLRHLDEGRLKDVLRAAATRFRWNQRREVSESGRGVGLACGTEKGSFVAACAEVVMVDGKAKLLEVCQVFECGAIQNPINLRAQHAGCLVMGLGGAGYEAIEFSGGRITNASFGAYRVPRMRDLPQLDLVELDRPDLPSIGSGETPIIAVAPAIANAIQHATGVRHRSLPMELV